VETSRLEAFADGVFAIAATLLIIYVSADAPDGGLGASLEHHWPQYAAYGVTFATIGIWWVNHHVVVSMIGRADRPFLFANIALLACIAFLPYPTKLVAEHFRDNGARAAVVAYGLTMTAAAVCFWLVWFYAAIGRRLIDDRVDQREVDHITRSIIPGVPINALAILLALWSPRAAMVLFAALTLFYVVGATILEREEIEAAG
jgi:uncharacterized membrane protein